MMLMASQTTPTMMPMNAFWFRMPAPRDWMNATMLRIRPMTAVHGMIARIMPTSPSVLPG